MDFCNYGDLGSRLEMDGNRQNHHMYQRFVLPKFVEMVENRKAYFKTHTTIEAMLIAGVSGIYALSVMDILNSLFSLSTQHPSQLLVCLFASWIVGIPMRYSPDAIHTYLFKNLRTHYYKPLGFALSSYSDAQSGIIVMATYLLIQRLISPRL